MRISSRHVVLAALLLVEVGAVVYLSQSESDAQQRPRWVGNGKYRVHIIVPADGTRPGDHRPASVELDLAGMLGGRPVDVAGMQLIQYNPATGDPLPGDGLLKAHSKWDVAFRWEDLPAPDLAWPTSLMYSLTSNGRAGKLVFNHRAPARGDGHYMLYFDAADPARGPGRSPRPIIGDCDNLCQSPGPVTSLSHTLAVYADWNNDGRRDLLVGDILGYITFHPNYGADAAPKFRDAFFLYADGKPLRVTWSATPCVVDWDGDGDQDLLAGHENAVFSYFENVGTATEPVLTDRGLVQADGEDLKTPAKPCVELPWFELDYEPCPQVVDWDGDGDLDLLAGGYLTGYIFYYENTRNGPGAPELTFRGPLQAGGEPFDAGWNASPAAGDYDGDGDLDLVSGVMDGRLVIPPDDPYPIAWYCENIGTRTEPRLGPKQRLPIRGPRADEAGSFTRASATDFNNDGRPDLLMSGSSDVYFLENIGNDGQVLFSGRPSLTAEWAPREVGGFASPIADWDGDGDWDIVSGGGMTATWLRNVDGLNPPTLESAGKVKADGKVISHEFSLGDDHTFPELYDWDGDGDFDYILGICEGHVWYYENVGTPQKPKLAAGKRFMLASGEPLFVGPPHPEVSTSFSQHSGNRADAAAGDYDGDGDNDLVVSDAYGEVVYFENVGTNAEPMFADGRLLWQRKARCLICGGDWDGDGRPDILACWSSSPVVFFKNLGARNGQVKWGEPQDINLRWIPYPHPYLVDFNGDGDLDLVCGSSYSFDYFIERSYYLGGYAQAKVVGQEQRK